MAFVGDSALTVALVLAFYKSRRRSPSARKRMLGPRDSFIQPVNIHEVNLKADPDMGIPAPAPAATVTVEDGKGSVMDSVQLYVINTGG